MRNVKILQIFIMLLISTITFGQEKVITGIVTDTYKPIPKINVSVQGSKISTITDADGSYSIKAKEGDLLVFDHFGCEKIDLKVGISNKINVKLNEKEISFIVANLCFPQNNNENDLQKNHIPKFYTINKDITTSFDLENNFKNNIANKSLKIYVFENKTNTISQNEFNFQNKYKLTFTTFYKISNDYYENYNKKVFDYLEDNFNDKWQNEINSDILGFEQWQNN